jgi:hypothetical protein
LRFQVCDFLHRIACAGLVDRATNDQRDLALNRIARAQHGVNFGRRTAQKFLMNLCQLTR